MDEIYIVDYDSNWPVLFEQESAKIKHSLSKNLVIRIEHFGSTAVPGLAAKPVIDLLVEVSSREAAKQVAIEPLAALGYAYWVDNPDPDRMFFVKGLPPNSPRTHHVHLVELDSILWERLKFRDYLRSHGAEAAHYANLKRDLAQRFATDREAYTQGKTAFIKSTMNVIRQMG